MRLRLALWYAAMLLLTVVGYGSLVYASARTARLAELDGPIDAGLSTLEASLRLFPMSEITGDDPPPPPPPPEGKSKGRPPGKGEPPGKGGPRRGPFPLREHLMNSLNLPGPPTDQPGGPYFAVWRPDGTLMKSVGRPAPSIVPQAWPSAYFVGRERVRVRFGPSESVMLVGRDAGPTLDGLTVFARQLTLAGVAVVAVALAGGWLVSRGILTPIRRIAATAARISGSHLSERIDTERIDTELRELADVLNGAFARLESAFERQARFTADAAHELRTPLAILRSEAELALSRPREGEQYRTAIANALRTAERMGALVERLLLLSRADAGWQGLRRERVDLGRSVREATEPLKRLARERDVTLEVKSEEVIVQGDAPALGQIAANLIANAVQHTPAGGRVTVKVANRNGAAVLSVRDTGAGIPLDDQAKIFERFYRVDKARARATGGTGLGLAICRAIAEGHGGSIAVESEVGRGSVFRVRLPVDPGG